MAKTLPFVKVIWHDAADEESTWVVASAIREFSEEPVEVVSFGYQVKKTAKYITLAADRIDLGTSERTWGRVTKIPMGMVQSLVELPEENIEEGE